MIKTRKEQRAEVENTRNLVHERLEGRDIEKAVWELIEKAEDVCIDEVGMPVGWDVENEDHKVAFLDMIARELTEIYFTPRTDGEGR